MADISEYRVGLILAVSEADGSSKKSGNNNKSLKVCSIDIIGTGEAADHPITVVTSAPNVREGSRVAVAPLGSTVLTEEGDELKITKTVVGGVASEGMLCDSRMLGWSGGAAGIAVQIPDSIPLGSPPPSSKPRMMGGGGADETTTPAVPTGPVTDGLFAPKLSKEEKKKLAAEKRAAKKAAKEASKEDS